MRTLRSADLVTGAFTIGIGITTLVASLSIKALAGESLDPRTLPAMVGWAMVLCGGAIMYNGWRYRGEPVPIHWPDKIGQNRLMITGALLLAYVILIETVGFPIVTAAFVAAHSWYLGRYRPWVAILFGGVTGVIVYYGFMEFLELTFPLGLLEYLR